MTYISQSHTWADATASTQDIITAVKLNGNNDDFINGLKDGTKDINVNEITGNFKGNAPTGIKLKTARDIKLTGDAEATQSFDGSSNITLAASGDKFPVAEAILSCGFPTASQAIMDGIAASLSVTTYEDFAVKWGAIQRSASNNDSTTLGTDIAAYNAAYTGDTISAGQTTTLNAPIGGTRDDFDDFVTVESSNNISITTTMTLEEAPNRLRVNLDLPISSVGALTQNLMPFVYCFGATGYMGDGSGGFTTIDVTTPIYAVSINELSATHLRLEVNFPFKIPTTFATIGNSFSMISMPSKIHILVYKVT